MGKVTIIIENSPLSSLELEKLMHQCFRVLDTTTLFRDKDGDVYIVPDDD